MIYEEQENIPHIRLRRLIEQLDSCISYLNFVSSFIEDLLAVNAHSSGSLTLAKAPFSPTKTFDFVRNLFKPYIKHKNIEILFEVASQDDMYNSNDARLL